MANYRHIYSKDGTEWHIMTPQTLWEALTIALMSWRNPDRIGWLVGVPETFADEHFERKQ